MRTNGNCLRTSRGFLGLFESLGANAGASGGFVGAA